MKNILFFGLLLFISVKTNAQSNINTKNGIALNGYDAVSYFEKNKSEKGNSKIYVEFQNTKYLFSSIKYKVIFSKNPNKYLPQFGGWCAFAMGDSGEKVEINPETFKIVNGKLYLFYNAYFNNTLKSWNKNESELLVRANENWKNFKK